MQSNATRAVLTGVLLLVWSSAQALPLTYDVNISYFASRTFAAAHTAKQKCINTCRARYRDCLFLKQIPSSECRGIYQDCTRYTCKCWFSWSTVLARVPG